jgi:hypothetical protein
LLDLLHASRLDQPEAAFSVLGRRLAVEIREAGIASTTGPSLGRRRAEKRT